MTSYDRSPPSINRYGGGRTPGPIRGGSTLGPTAGWRLPGPIGIHGSDPRTFADQVEAAEDLDWRLRGRMVRRSRRFRNVHNHRGYSYGEDNPFVVNKEDYDPRTTAVWEADYGYDFAVMRKSTTMTVRIHDLEDTDAPIHRRFLTPHVLSGGAHVSLSNFIAAFVRKETTFNLTAVSEGLVRILALDMLGRCRGELTISIKRQRRLSLAFVRIHNGRANGEFRNAVSLGEADIRPWVTRLNRILTPQIAYTFDWPGPILEQEVAFDLSGGLTYTDWETHAKMFVSPSADLLVQLYERFRQPFLPGRQARGIANLGSFANRGRGNICLSCRDLNDYTLAHEIGHTMISPQYHASLGMDTEGHYGDHSIEGLMTALNVDDSRLQWRDVNVINQSGLEPGQLSGLINDPNLWRVTK